MDTIYRNKTAILMSLAILLLIGNCRKSEIGSKPDYQGPRIVEKKGYIPPVVIEEYDSPSAEYSFQMLGFPGVEECKPPGLSWQSEHVRSNKTHPCGFRIVDSVSGRYLMQYVLSETLLPPSIPPSAGVACKEISIKIVYGFLKWSNDNKVLFHENGLWWGAADWSEKVYSFDWRNCQVSLLWDIEEPHCPSLCNSQLFVADNDKEYLLFYDSESKRENIYSHPIDGLDSEQHNKHDFYDDVFMRATWKEKIDPNKSRLVFAIQTSKRPKIVARFNGDHNDVLIEAAESRYVFNPNEETLVQMGTSPN